MGQFTSLHQNHVKSVVLLSYDARAGENWLLLHFEIWHLDTDDTMGMAHYKCVRQMYLKPKFDRYKDTQMESKDAFHMNF